MTKVFLGGTVNGSIWRKKLIPMLDIGYFDPVVEEWDEAAYQKELHERATCDYCLYVITPMMEGVYSIAEVVDDSNKRPDKVLFCFLTKDKNQTFSTHQIKALRKVKQMIVENGGKGFEDLIEIANFLNNKR